MLSLIHIWRNVFIIGGNKEAARLSGISVTKTTMFSFAIHCALVALAGMILASRLYSGLPSAGKNMEMNAITAVVPVSYTHLAGAMQQVEYLAKLGHTRIALIKGTDFDSNGIDRLRGFHMGMEKMGLPVRPEYIVGGEFLEDAAYRATVELLSRPERPTAIIAHNNLMCIGAYRALRDMRINIPAEISLIGFDDFEFSEHLQPSITLIDRPVREMGELAGKMMIERIEKTYTGAARQVVFPVRLKVGGSCSVPADK